MQTVLIVDDNELVRETLVNRLQKECSEVVILQASSYKESIKYILDKSTTIDVAVVDLNLPDVNDGAVANFTLKKNIPTVVLTALDDEKTDNFLQKRDFFDYVRKSDFKGYDIVVKNIKRLFRNKQTNILVVDDSPLQLKSIVNMLEKLSFNVDTARDGQEALDIIKKEEKKYSIVITDYNMPIMDGIELTINLRDLYDKDELAIIALSINDAPEIPLKFLKLGANDFLNKPFVPVEVSTRINANLDILELFKKIKDMANKDFLTGAFNRRYFFDSADAIFEKAKRKEKNIAIAMFDIDKFKVINDTYGHDIGDIVLVETTKILNNNLRTYDLMSRFGGEEFCVLLEDITQEDTLKLFEKIRLVFENNIIDVDEHKIKFTVSIGICYGLKDSLEEMIKIADNGLYFAKEHGRNQVVITEKIS